MIEWEQRNIPLLHAGYFGIMIPLTNILTGGSAASGQGVQAEPGAL